MKLLQFAIESIIDAHPSQSLIDNTGRIDYVAAERRGRVLRAHSASTLISKGKSLLDKAISAYRERTRHAKALKALAPLSDHLLRDIGISRGDLMALKDGQIKLDELGARRYVERSENTPAQTKSARTDPQVQEISPANEASYLTAKCA